MSKGIIRCGLKIGDTHSRFVEVGDVIFIQKGINYEFYIEADNNFFDSDTKDLEEKVRTAKWAYISDGFFDTAQKKGQEVYSEWGYFNENRSKDSVPYLGIGNQYKLGSSLSFQFNEESAKINSWIGNGYRVEVFNKIPNAGLYFTIVPYLDPFIRYAYFEIQNDLNVKKSKENEAVDKTYFYDESTKLSISLHRCANSLLDNDSFYENLEIQVFLTDGDIGQILLDIPILDEYLEKHKSKFTEPNSGWLNSKLDFDLKISEDWKDEYHIGIENKNYSVEIHLIDKKTNTFTKFNIRNKNYSIFGNSGDQEHNVRYRTSNFFSVKKSAFDIAIFKETEKSNMIQYIGDVKFTKKEIDPCKYSEILIQQDGGKENNKKRVIFSEGEKFVNDITETYFEIIAGDDEKSAAKIDIILNGLEHTEVLCQGILLDRDEKHTDIHTIFKTNKIFSARPRIKFEKTSSFDKNQLEDTKVKVDHTRVEINKIPIQEKSQLPKASDNNYEGQNVEYEADEIEKGDYDMVAVSEYDIRDVLDLEEGKDYTIVENANQKSATFTFNKLNFYYDKKLGGTDAEKHKEEENIVDYLWIFNYFWLPENLAQTYFVPISTCRYPNQIAKIKIYPDLEWEIKLDFGATVPESKSHRNMPSEHGVFEKHQKEAKEAGDNRRWLNSEVSFALAIKAKSGDFEREISASYEQKIRSFLQILVTIKDFLDTISGSTEAKKSKGNLAKEALSKIPNKLKLPISFEIEYPTINITGSWKNELYKEQPKVGKTGSLSFGFTPLIKGRGTLDLLACLDYLPVVGPVFKAAALVRDAINNYTPLTAEIYLNIYAFGQIDLKANIIIGNEESGGELECDTTVGLGLEMGVTAGAEVPKLSFGANEVDDSTKKEESGFGFEAEASAKGETSLIFKGKRGISNKGIYIELGVDFGGMQAYVTAKFNAKSPIGEFEAGVSDKPYTVLDPKPDILKGKYYIIENNQ